jgi:nucleotide-binding universal stress UspA family protein
MKTLLALIDDPADSEGFIRYAFEFARESGLDLHFLYIQNPVLSTLDSGSAVDTTQPAGDEFDITRVEKERKNALVTLGRKLKALRNSIYSDTDIGLSSEIGAMDQVVNRLAADNKADMLILEGHIEKGLWPMDSVNMELIMNIDCPGLLIPEGIEYRSYRKIIYATDYNPKDVQTLKDLIAITGKFSPDITALHLTGSDETGEQLENREFKEMIVRQTGYEKISVEVIRSKKGMHPGEIINDYAARENADLLVLLKENKKFLEKIFKPGFSRKIIKKIRLPVLVYHEK